MNSKPKEAENATRTDVPRRLVYGFDEAAFLLDIHPSTLKRLFAKGEIEGTQVTEGRVGFTERQLIEYLEARTIRHEKKSGQE